MNKTLEKVAENYVNNFEYDIAHPRRVAKNAFINGAKWQAKITYTEQEMLHILDTLWDRLDLWYNRGMESDEVEFNLRKWFDECELKKRNNG